jgi:gamma-glutamyltranspeptidase/glutathione hydrolase
MVATSQPLAVQAGLEVLKEGGNAIDAALAAVAVLGVTEPMSTGIGGDLFALVYHAQTQQLYALNASGPAPRRASLEEYTRRGHTQMPQDGILSVTVPGALRGWEALLERFGSRPLGGLIESAIEYAERGFPVMEITSRRWRQCEEKLKRDERSAQTYLMDDRAPRPGEVFRNERLARTLRTIAQEGVGAFYEGEIASEILETSEANGGLLSLDDLENYRPQWVEPISTEYHGVTLYEHPPNAQGLIALLALSILENFDPAAMGANSAGYYHTLIEALKLAFADGKRYIADPRFAEVPLEKLLSKAYAAERRALIGERALPDGLPEVLEGGTVYVTAVDEERNVVSLIESVFMPFGSGVTAGDTGIVLQNRGALFSLDPEHPNRLEPGKRPYHTIIPAMAFRDGKPWLGFGVVGGFMQPQGHVQILCNLIDHGLDLQQAIDAPRVRYYGERKVALEPAIPPEIREELAHLGHELIEGDGNFGGAQAILIDPETGALAGGSDPRKDGCAQGF